MGAIHLILYIVYISIVVGVVITVLIDKKQPAKTVAWLLVVIFLPVFGLILYLFLGQNLRKERNINKKNLVTVDIKEIVKKIKSSKTHTTTPHQSLINQFEFLCFATPFANNNINVLYSGYDFFLTLIEQLGKAKHHIHIISYAFENDSLGNLIADVLIDKAKEGVEVRIIYDDVGCWNVKNSFFKKMINAGIEVESFMPVMFPAFTSKVNYRNHKKIIVIDGMQGFIGGMNIAVRYVKGKPNLKWKDTHMQVEGNVVFGLQEVFLMDWFFVKRKHLKGEDYFPINKIKIENNCIAQVVTSNPTSENPEIMYGYVRVLLEAKKYVYIETPYFIPTEMITFALKSAAMSGIDVKIIIPKQTDAKLAQWASTSYIYEIARSGVEVYMYKGAFNHSKLLICDDNICSCGSTNVDARSFDNNFEANIFIYNENTTTTLKQLFINDLNNSEQLDINKYMKNRSFLLHIWESFVRLLSPLL